MNGEDSPGEQQQQAGTHPPADAPTRDDHRLEREEGDEGTCQGKPPSYHMPTRPIEWLQFGVNASLAVIAIGALCVYHSQLGAMKAQQKVMQGQVEEMQIEHRPWVGPSAMAEITITNTPAGLHFDASVEIKNFGPSAAFRVVPMVEESGFQHIAALVQIKDGRKSDLCQVADTIVNTDKVSNLSESGFPLYPQAPIRAGAVPRAGAIQLDDELAVVGCIAYVDQLHSSEVKSPIHHSWFCYGSIDPFNKLIADVADKTKYPDGKRVAMMNCNFYQGAD
jgi:hypothetical protein